jgi:hypothetical protein
LVSMTVCACAGAATANRQVVVSRKRRIRYPLCFQREDGDVGAEP